MWETEGPGTRVSIDMAQIKVHVQLFLNNFRMDNSKSMQNEVQSGVAGPQYDNRVLTCSQFLCFYSHSA